MKANLHKS